MKKYTVLVLRPDYIANDYGQDTYQAWVKAIDVLTAQETAQREAYQEDFPGSDAEEHDPVSSCADYFILAVYEGHCYDLKTEG